MTASPTEVTPFALLPRPVIKFLSACHLSSAEWALVVAVFSYRSKTCPNPFLADPTVATATGLNRRRVFDAKQALARDGILHTGKRPVGRGREVTVYDLAAMERTAMERPDGLPRTKRVRPDRVGLRLVSEGPAKDAISGRTADGPPKQALPARMSPPSAGASPELHRAYAEHLAARVRAFTGKK